MIEERFVYIRSRRSPYENYNSFRIEDKYEEIPTMHFLTRKEMMSVFDLLKEGRMRFELK